MKIVQAAVLLLASAVLLSGCAGFWDAPVSTTTTTTATPTTDSSGFFYVLNKYTSQLVGYSISSGTLESVSGGTPYAIPTPLCIAIAPSGAFLYAGTENGIYLYAINQSTGVLTLQNNGAAISTDAPAAMQVYFSSTTGATGLLVDAYMSGSYVRLDAIPINSTTGDYAGSGGAPPSQTFYVASASVYRMALSPYADEVFVALGAGGTIIVPFSPLSSNPLGSTAITIPVLNNQGSALSVAVDPTERLFYIGQTEAASGSGGVVYYNYSALTAVPLTLPLPQASGSPIASGGISPNVILPLGSAGGDYVYVANGEGPTSTGNIAEFSIAAATSGTGYTMAAGSTIGAGIDPMGLAEDSENNFVLAVSDGGSTLTGGDPDLEAYTMSSGTLTSAITSATGTSEPVEAFAIAAAP